MRSDSNLPSRTDNPQSNNNKQEGPSDSNYAHIKAQDKTTTEHIRTRTPSLERKVKIQELTDHRDYFRSSSEGLTRLSTPDRALLALLLNRILYKCRTASRAWCLNFHHKGGIYWGEWDLHQLGEVGLPLGGGQPAGQVERPPMTQPSTHVDAWQPRHGPNHLKP
jgi:hypothetical protein